MPRLLLLLLVAALPLRAAPDPTPHRVVILTDIEADPDDTQSLVRLLLYSNEIEIRGLIATTSIHLRDRVEPDSIRAVIRAYGQVMPNLRDHDPRYPDAATLLDRVSAGLPRYGMTGVGDDFDSAGSAALLTELRRDDDRPLWVSVWGGPNTLAQALYRLRATVSPEELARLLAKLRVYTIADQDDSGAWIRTEFPDLFYIVSPGGYGKGTWSGIMHVVDGLDNHTVSNAWLAAHIQQGHGPLGAMYPDVAYGMEGDTPAFLSLIPNGLNKAEHPDFGGWGGRYVLRTPAREETDPDGFTGGVPVPAETRPIWTNATDTVHPIITGEHGRALQPLEQSFTGFRATIWRWRDAFQNDFAARMDWTTHAPADANHPPVPRLSHPHEITVRSGDWFAMDARTSTDPDGDSLSFYWEVYPEAGTLPEGIRIPSAPNLARLACQAPVVTAPQTVHFILHVMDKGTPRLTRYQRVIVTILPR